MLGLTDEQIDLILVDIFDGKTNINNLPPRIYYATVDRLVEGMFSGMTFADEDADLKNPQLAQFFRENIGTFSGAKTYQQTKALQKAKELNEQVLNPDGTPKTFAEFKASAMSILTEFNVNYLETEFESAVSVAQMGVKWTEFERDKDIFPYLTIRTVGDDAVRDEHALWDGFTARVDNPVWEYALPPLGWRCRCDAEQSDDGPETATEPDLESIDPVFRFNPGMTGQIFDGSHPYFQIDPADQSKADKNFGFPIDPVGPRKD